ncbi:SETMR methyltransferase, partial [Acromyrmex heyeri]
LIFQDDGTPAHFSQQVRDILDTRYSYKWMGRSGPIIWPARDEFREGRPSTSVVATNVDAVREMIERDRHMTYREIQASLGIDMKAIHTILHNHLSVWKLCSRWMPHNLTEVQKQVRVKWKKEMLKKFNRGRSNLIYNIVTGDETWIYSYEPESKQQSTVWVFQNEPKPTKIVHAVPSK